MSGSSQDKTQGARARARAQEHRAAEDRRARRAGGSRKSRGGTGQGNPRTGRPRDQGGKRTRKTREPNPGRGRREPRASGENSHTVRSEAQGQERNQRIPRGPEDEREPMVRRPTARSATGETKTQTGREGGSKKLAMGARGGPPGQSVGCLKGGRTSGHRDTKGRGPEAGGTAEGGKRQRRAAAERGRAGPAEHNRSWGVRRTGNINRQSQAEELARGETPAAPEADHHPKDQGTGDGQKGPARAPESWAGEGGGSPETEPASGESRKGRHSEAEPRGQGQGKQHESHRRTRQGTTQGAPGEGTAREGKQGSPAPGERDRRRVNNRGRATHNNAGHGTRESSQSSPAPGKGAAPPAHARQGSRYKPWAAAKAERSPNESA